MKIFHPTFPTPSTSPSTAGGFSSPRFRLHDSLLSPRLGDVLDYTLFYIHFPNSLHVICQLSDPRVRPLGPGFSLYNLFFFFHAGHSELCVNAENFEPPWTALAFFATLLPPMARFALPFLPGS